MDILNHIINGLNKEQVRFFKMYLSRIETEDDRKDVLLFDYIRRSGENFDEEKIFTRLYKSKEKNSFYRLKNRLMREVNKSLTIQHFDDETIVYIFRLLALVKFYLNKNSIKPANYFLRKAESKAQSIENHELLDIIYGEFIRLSREMISINPEEYIEKRKENQKKLNSVRAIDDILAAVTYRLKVTQNYTAGENPILNLLEKTINDFTADKTLLRSPQLRFRIYNAVSQVLLQKHQYKVLEDYLLKTYRTFLKEKLFSKNNHDSKLQMLVYIINSLYKNGKLNKSLEFAEVLHKSMKEFGNMLYDKYLFYYYNSQVINYSQLNGARAIEILEELKENDKLKSNLFYQRFIYLNLFTIWFDLKDFHKAAKNLTKLYMLKDYKEADASLRFKIAIADLITRHELGDTDTLEYKMKQVKKDFKELIQLPELESEKKLIEILQLMTTSNQSRKKSLPARIKSFLKEKQTIPSEDAGLINYHNWLKEKTKKIR